MASAWGLVSEVLVLAEGGAVIGGRVLLPATETVEIDSGPGETAGIGSFSGVAAGSTATVDWDVSCWESSTIDEVGGPTTVLTAWWGAPGWKGGRVNVPVGASR